tara:strand:- start:919 stop:1197 length:279 start_codon:yes stop_codon:yes gene_type:complete
MKNPREVFNYNKLNREDIEFLETQYLKYWNDLSLQGDKYGWWIKTLCPNCYNELEKEKEIDYPYVCRNCDENFYDFETIKKYLGKDVEKHNK